MKKLILTFIVLTIGTIGFFWFRPNVTTDDVGTVTIILVDEDDSILYEEALDIEPGDTLM